MIETIERALTRERAAEETWRRAQEIHAGAKTAVSAQVAWDRYVDYWRAYVETDKAAGGRGPGRMARAGIA